MKIRRCCALGALAIALLAGSVGQAQAGLVNGGFETGNLSGWSTNGGTLTSVVTAADGKSAYEGIYFAHLTAGLGANVYTVVDQTFAASAGQIVTGAAYFQAADYMPYNDDAYVKITQGNTILFSANVATVGNYGSTPWTPFSYMFTSGGTYTIEAGVRNSLDNALSSAMGVDAVLVTETVPEPASLLVWGLGMASFVGVARMKKRKTNLGAL